MDISIIAVITSLVSLGVVIWGMAYRWGKVATDIENIKKDVRDSLKLAREAKDIADSCKLKIEPFWDLIRQQLPNLLNVPRSRNLLEKLADDSITDEELIHLEDEIQKQIPDGVVDKPEILAKAFSLWAICIRKAERGINHA